ncbi:MAG TPA: hypothetical protein IAB65_04520 [Candidatus Onthocola stercorigallinarum]|nr:hypothetical protein [Candidatus Onthocola stercorigallinarum]
MFIDLDPNELKKISIDIEGYDDALNNDYFPNALQYVSDLIANTNGIKTEEVVNILKGINEKLTILSDSIKSNLYGLEEQIAESLEAYRISTEDAREKLAQLFLVMQEFVKSGKIDMSIVSSDGYITEDTGEEPTQPSGELYDDMVDYLGEEFVDGNPSPGVVHTVVHTYLEQRMDNLKTDLDPMIDEFIQDYQKYVYDTNDTVHTGVYVDQPISSFLNSDAGAKYAQFLEDSNVGNNDYLTILNNPDRAFAEYLQTAVNEDTYMKSGEYHDMLYNDMYDVLSGEWVARHNS